MEAAHCRSSPDYQHQSFRHDLLFAGWITCEPRHHRFHVALVSSGFQPEKQDKASRWRADRNALLVLAFRGRGVGRCLYRRLYRRPLIEATKNVIKVTRHASEGTIISSDDCVSGSVDNA